MNMPTIDWERTTTSPGSTRWEAFENGLSVATILHERGAVSYWLWLPAGGDGEAYPTLAAAKAAAETSTSTHEGGRA